MAKKYDFGEKTEENGAAVWLSPKYQEAKAKAIEILESDEYKGKLQPSDFWILKNKMKNGSIMYSGLIISHNGCLKINDALPNKLKFNPLSLSMDKDGYNKSLVFTYCNELQGLYEVGEVSAANCKVAYPYAMALKRAMDRVILKNSKLAYSGIYSDSEADEMREPEPVEEKKKSGSSTGPKENPSIRAEFARLIADNRLDIRKVAKKYKLNNGSSDDDFFSAYYDLEGLIDTNDNTINELREA